MAPTPEQTAAGYHKLWREAHVLPTRRLALEKIAKKIIANRGTYEAIERKIGVPWEMVGVIHSREASLDFRAVLHNGERIIGTGRKTKLVPAGRGPFKTWEAAAIDALGAPPHSLGKIKKWPIERILYELEKYNGWGYLGKCNSPYLWSFTDQYHGGKYVADHVFSHSAWDQQAGCVAILKVLADLDVSARLLPPPPDIRPEVAVASRTPWWLASLFAAFGRRK